MLLKIALLTMLAVNVFGVLRSPAEQDPLPGCFPCRVAMMTAK